jgi:glycosyltransferase involved in cell wall biosynthesis
MGKLKNKIFIQIASYRDPQLIPTLKDCLDNAKNPENLVFGICWQHDDTENLDEFKNDKRFKIIDVPFKDSKGVCWARNAVQQLYSNEEYTLQIDSHMRFNKNWDETLIDMVKQLQEMGYKKPLLTAYAPSFNPENDPQERAQKPWRMVFDRFIPEGAVFFLPEDIPNHENLKYPTRARFYSAHMCFTLGEFSVEVQHNPEYYFHGEEISIAARAYTHGYDLFHPHKVVIWHEYTRKGRTKQWDDDKQWGDRNRISHLTNRKLFGMDGEKQEGHDGIYGFGKVRTLKEYEEYSGLLFSERSVQQFTLDKKDPPNPSIEELGGEENWKKEFAKVFKHCIDIGYHQVPEKDYEFWCVAFHDENDETLYRKDADKSEIDRMLNDPDKYCKVWREFQTTSKPKYWVVWPFSKSKGWSEKITGFLY